MYTLYIITPAGGKHWACQTQRKPTQATIKSHLRFAPINSKPLIEKHKQTGLKP